MQAAAKAGEAKAGGAKEASAWAPKPDIIDMAADKAREWSSAVLVSTCVATRHLEDQLKDWAAEWAATKSKK
jgi:hypothetical protein